MKLQYQQAYSIRMPLWMNEAQKDHYKLKEHRRQKMEQQKLSKLEELDKE